MTYTATGAGAFRDKGGSLTEKLGAEFAAIKVETDSLRTAGGKAAINIVDLTASTVSSTSLAANGVDLASGTDHTYYAVWVAPVACTILYMDTILTEAYVKETNDAKIEIIDNAGSPVTRVTYTLPTAGRAVKSLVSTAPVSGATAALAAGDILALKITETLSSSGTGHAKVMLRYTVD
jgi:hypothetical protein